MAVDRHAYQPELSSCSDGCSAPLP
jgi:hypothetical protein